MPEMQEDRVFRFRGSLLMTPREATILEAQKSVLETQRMARKLSELEKRVERLETEVNVLQQQRDGLL